MKMFLFSAAKVFWRHFSTEGSFMFCDVLEFVHTSANSLWIEPMNVVHTGKFMLISLITVQSHRPVSNVVVFCKRRTYQRDPKNSVHGLFWNPTLFGQNSFNRTSTTNNNPKFRKAASSILMNQRETTDSKQAGTIILFFLKDIHGEFAWPIFAVNSHCCGQTPQEVCWRARMYERNTCVNASGSWSIDPE